MGRCDLLGVFWYQLGYITLTHITGVYPWGKRESEQRPQNEIQVDLRSSFQIPGDQLRRFYKGLPLGDDIPITMSQTSKNVSFGPRQKLSSVIVYN